VGAHGGTAARPPRHDLSEHSKDRDSQMFDPYAVLEVSPTATQTEITHAYRLRLRNYHPDTRSPLPSDGADERLRQILAAYALLRDPSRRADYDRTAERAPTGLIQIPVTDDYIEQQPPIWVGPVRWRPG
jgi:curved DNA-binding protein CbpA